MRINGGRRFGLIAAVLAATVLGLTAACSKLDGEDIGPDVVGSTLIEAEAILVAWCENVRVVVDPVVALDVLDPAQVRVSDKQTGSADPAAPPPAGTLRVGWALDPPASTSNTAGPTESAAATEPTLSGSPPSANGLAHRLAGAQASGPIAEEEPPSTDFCRTGRVPTVYVSLEAEVPDLRGVPVSEAIALLAERGIVADAPPAYDRAALVETQLIAPGTLVALGVAPDVPAVAVTPGEVPANLVLIDVPDVEHLAVNAGCVILRSEGFECSVLTAGGEVAYEPDWEIVSQWPRVPARAAEGATVKVVVTGPTFAVVPGVVAMPYGTACELLRDEHLICRVSGDLGKREVSAQSPDPGASVTPGSVVTLQFTPVPWYETWNGRLLLLFVGGIVAALGGLFVRFAFGGRRRRARSG